MRVPRLLLAAASAFVMTCAPAHAAAGAIDTAFAKSGFATTAPGTWAGAAANLVQPDGRIVTAGQAKVNGIDVILANRFNADGSLDTGFGTNGTVTVPVGAAAGMDSGAALVRQGDGKLVLVGTGTVSAGMHFTAVRLTSNGARDKSFGTQGIATVPIGRTSIANAVVVQPDGRIVISGGAIFGSEVRYAVTRLTAKGNLDTSYGTNGITSVPVTGTAWGMVLQSDGRVVLGGQATTGSRPYVAVRLTSSGALDPTFDGDGIRTVDVAGGGMCVGIALQGDGRLVLTGAVDTASGTAVGTIRLNADGSLDPAFGAGGISTFAGNGVNALVIQPDGRIVLAGVGATAARLLANGAMDMSFGKSGVTFATLGTNDAANGVALQSDGKIVLGGAATIDGRPVVSVVRLLGA